MVNEITSDIIVVGSGLAALNFALIVARNSKYTVNVVTKRRLQDANTHHAQGGIASVLAKQDTFEEHIQDTIVAGDFLCRENVVREIIKCGPAVVAKFIELGVAFDRGEDGNLDLGREGGHSQRRVAHVKDYTGKAIHDAYIHAVRNEQQITIYENHIVIDLQLINDQVAGAYVLDTAHNEVLNFSAKVTVLATGGAGKVYRYTTNPDTATGDGIAMAFRIGATIANMEFTQFHPTLLYNLHEKNFLISEAVRGEGAVLRNMSGKRFMQGIHPLADLAPRDITARAIDAEMKKNGEDFVYLDISFKPAAFIQQRFPLIYNKVLELGTDMTKAPIPVVPAAHYTVGGVQTDLYGRTSQKGLYAIGEVAYTGLHGANRLASNSLLEAAVISKNAADDVMRALDNNQLIHYSIPKWELGDAVSSDEAVIISHNWSELRRLMWNYVGIVRTTKRLLRARSRLDILKQEVLEYYWKYHITPDIVELRNIVDVAALIVDSALFRKESRGTHYITDYPTHRCEKRDTLVQKGSGIYYSDIIPKYADEA